MVIETRVNCGTVSVALALIDPDSAVMSVKPGPLAIAIPDCSIAAMSERALVHVTVEVKSRTLPSEKIPVAAKRSLSPYGTVAVAGEIFIDFRLWRGLVAA
jgi:hypothetical protein